MTSTSYARRPSLQTLVRRALEGEASLPPSSTVVVAVSGGPDSMALLDALARAASSRSSDLHLRVVAHGVDHGLRDDASRELDLAEAFAKERSVPFDRTRLAVAPGGNLQARARTARWGALVAAARHRSAAIATGHHAGDRAETVLMRLLRGAGLRGLAILPARATAPGAPDVTVIRPLLRAERSDVVLHLERHRIPHAADPSNENPRFLRTRVRSRVLPLLAELDPGIVRHLADLADELASRTDPEAALAATDPSWAAGLPRATQAAIQELLRSRSRDARIWLPGGLVLSLDARGQGGQRGGAGDRARQQRTSDALRRGRLPGGKSSG